MKRVRKNKWFILLTLVFLFIMASGTKVALAGTDSELTQILQSGLAGLQAYFDWLLEVLNVVW